MKHIVFLTMTLLFVLTGCSNDESEKNNTLVGTVWMMRYQDGEREGHTITGLTDKDGNSTVGAQALVFREKTVALYLLDKQDRVVRHWETYNYRQKGNTYYLGKSERAQSIKEHMLDFDGYPFYRSNLKESDLDFTHIKL